MTQQEHLLSLCQVCSRESRPLGPDERSIVFTPSVILGPDGAHELLCELRRIQMRFSNIVCVAYGHVHVCGSFEALQPVGILFAVLGATYNNPYLYYYAERILSYRQEKIRQKILYVGKPEPVSFLEQSEDGTLAETRDIR
jgi:hypothetical protein